jgi:diacylglycerol kinase (ATP)
VRAIPDEELTNVRGVSDVSLARPAGAGTWRRLLASFGFAWEGIRYTARTQPNWGIHVVIAVGALALGVALRVPPVELAILALTIGLVLALECMNTALEAAIDALGGPPTFAAKCAKDAAAGAVLVGAVTAVAVGAVILGPGLFAARSLL